MALGSRGTLDALVVGAGPVGLTMAAELTRHGVACRIVDQSPEPSDKSKALVLWPRTLEMLEDIGAIGPFLAAGHPAHGGSIYAGRKRLVHLSFDFDSPYAQALMIPQSETEHLLAAHLGRLGLEVERGIALTDVIQDEEGVSCRLSRLGGDEESVRVPWLLGCDGAHSTVRHQLGIEFSGEAEPNDWVLADVHLHGPVPDDEILVHFHDRGVLLFFPIAPGRFRVVADVGTARSVERPPDPTLEEVQRLVDERGPGGLTLNDPVWLAGFRIHERKVAHFRRGRAFLAGDAAHIHSPAGGQGMNTGMQDAYNLAWKLALVHRGLARDVLLESFDVERGAVADVVLRNAGVLTRAATLRNPLARQVRNHAYALLGSLDLVQHRLSETMGELGIHYRRSPITGEQRGGLAHAWLLGGGVRAGDRMPDAELVDASSGAPTRVFEVIGGTGHTLLLLTGVESPGAQVAGLEAIAAAVRERHHDLVSPYLILPEEETSAPPSDVGLRDPAQVLHRRLGAASPTLYLVRPDGYVGFRSQPADAPSLLAHLAKYLI
jgi:2-polyprenyl-6-methoxyphenol hydroxylase-like FAD-dependent oxidoreductase